MREAHTIGVEGTSEKAARYCVECSELAKDWVSWPCSREKLVKTAVDAAILIESMDSAENRWAAYFSGWDDAMTEIRSKKWILKLIRAL